MQVLKEMAEELSPSLALIFSASLQQGKIPQDWRKALITPLFKKGDQTNPTNYRPVSLTSICCKLLEHIIHSNVMSHLNAHNIISDNQYGFHKRRSVELQLIRTTMILPTILMKGNRQMLYYLTFVRLLTRCHIAI